MGRFTAGFQAGPYLRASASLVAMGLDPATQEIGIELVSQSHGCYRYTRAANTSRWLEP